jgi:hypothetical protein
MTSIITFIESLNRKLHFNAYDGLYEEECIRILKDIDNTKFYKYTRTFRDETDYDWIEEHCNFFNNDDYIIYTFNKIEHELFFIPIKTDSYIGVEVFEAFPLKKQIVDIER